MPGATRQRGAPVRWPPEVFAQPNLADATDWKNAPCTSDRLRASKAAQDETGTAEVLRKVCFSVSGGAPA